MQNWCHVAISSIVPAHLKNQLNSWKHGQGCGLVNGKKINFWCKDSILHNSWSTCLLSCNQVAASRMQIVPEWPPIACKLYPSGRQSHANWVAASRMQIVPKWPPVAWKFPLILFMLHVTGGHAGTICMQLAATQVQFKGTVSQDFSLLVFFINQFPPSPRVSH